MNLRPIIREAVGNAMQQATKMTGDGRMVAIESLTAVVDFAGGHYTPEELHHLLETQARKVYARASTAND